MDFSLDFTPRHQLSPLFPRCTWRRYTLNHFSSEAFSPQSERDLSDLGLAEALKLIYPELTWTELARLHSKLQTVEPTVDFAPVARAYGMGFEARTLKTFSLYLGLSPETQSWIEKQNFSWRDLQPVFSLKTPSEPLWELLRRQPLSRSFAVQILELLVELTLLDTDSRLLTPPDVDGAIVGTAWIESLKKIRYPQTTNLDLNRENQFSRWPWTKDFQTRWFRKGDRSGLEVKFIVTSKSDLEQKIKSLERVHEGSHD